MFYVRCAPTCNRDLLTYIAERRNPEFLKSTNYALLGCMVCGALWEYRPEYEVEDRFGPGVTKSFEVSASYVKENYSNINSNQLQVVLNARR